MNYTLTGRIKTAGGNETSTPLLVKAHAIELGKRTFIGESWTASRTPSHGMKSYEIIWETTDDKSVNVRLSVYSPDAILLGQTEVITAIPRHLKEHIFISEMEAYEAFLEFSSTEYGTLKSGVMVVLASTGTSINELTEADVVLLESSLGEEDGLFHATNITRLVKSEQLSLVHDLPATFFYGIAALEPEIDMSLDAFLAFEDSELMSNIAVLVEKKIIPNLEIESLLGQLNKARFKQQSIVSKRFTIQLFDEENDKPLVSYKIQAVMTLTESLIGTAWTDQKGLSTFKYNGKKGKQDTVTLTISDLRNQFTVSQKVEVDEGVVPFYISLPDVEDTSLSLYELSESIGLSLPETLQAYFEESQLSLRKVFQQNGFKHITDLPVAPDHPALIHLNRHVEFYGALAGYDPTMVEYLIGRGYHTLDKIAKTPRVRFVQELGPQIGNYEAASLLQRAQVSRAVYHNLLPNRTGEQPEASQSASTTTVETISQFDTTGDNEACQNIPTAVSPAAYMSDLVKYIQEHVQIGEDQSQIPLLMKLSDLEEHFSQPFAALPLSNDAVDQEVFQVRLAIEVLRPYMANEQLPIAGSAEEVSLQKNYQNYLEAVYAALLLRGGTSYGEIRQVVRSGNPEKLESLRQRLALPDSTALSTLLIDKHQLTEDWLEHIFGLVSTTTPPLSNGVLLFDDNTAVTDSPLAYWSIGNIRWNQNTDEDGYIYLTIEAINGLFQLSIYKEEQRTSEALIAQVQTDNPNGLVTLSANDSGSLEGQFQLNYTTDVLNIKISVVPLWSAWQSQFLYQQVWQAQAFSEPVIDPDLITIDYLHPHLSSPAVTLWVDRNTFINNRLDHWRSFQINLNEAERLQAFLDEKDIDLVIEEEDSLKREKEYL